LPPQLQNVEWSGAKDLSQDALDKGEAFILALIAEGHTYDSMKAAFIKCVLRTWLRLTKGNVSQIAKKMATDINWISRLLTKLDMRAEVESIRSAANAEMNGAEK
jgi:DNA-binding MarR family transcriptional regulator